MLGFVSSRFTANVCLPLLICSPRRYGAAGGFANDRGRERAKRGRRGERAERERAAEREGEGRGAERKGEGQGREREVGGRGQREGEG